MDCERYEHLITLEAYEQGKDAWEDAWEITANPYPVGTDSHQAWVVGWKEAEDLETVHDITPITEYL